VIYGAAVILAQGSARSREVKPQSVDAVPPSFSKGGSHTIHNSTALNTVSKWNRTNNLPLLPYTTWREVHHPLPSLQS